MTAAETGLIALPVAGSLLFAWFAWGAGAEATGGDSRREGQGIRAGAFALLAAAAGFCAGIEFAQIGG